MKYVVYAALAFVAALLFLPEQGSTQIRNLPILLFLLYLLLAVALWRLLQYARLMAKAKKLLKKQGIFSVRLTFLPWASLGRGRYSLTFPYGDDTVQIMLFSRKRKYPRYHFERADCIEFYRTNRVIFNSIKAKGATVSHLSETNLVGKQRISWNQNAPIRVVLFDKLPHSVTDSIKKEALDVGERILNQSIYLLDWDSLCKQAKNKTK